MPMVYWIDPVQRIVFSRGSGVVTPEDLIDHRQRLAADPDFGPDLRQLIDFTDIERLGISAYGMREFARSNIFDTAVRRAVAAPDEATYGLARMFQIVADELAENFGVFRTLDEARDWLGLAPDQDAPAKTDASWFRSIA